MHRLAPLLVLLFLACPGNQSQPTKKVEPTPSPTLPKKPVVPGTPAIASDIKSYGDRCESDADCLITTFNGCCACPQCSIGEPAARSRIEQKRAEEVCGIATCDMKICDVAGMCLPGEAAGKFLAKCSNEQCIGIRKSDFDFDAVECTGSCMQSVDNDDAISYCYEQCEDLCEDVCTRHRENRPPARGISPPPPQSCVEDCWQLVHQDD
jgi:hypothetical protein